MMGSTENFEKAPYIKNRKARFVLAAARVHVSATV